MILSQQGFIIANPNNINDQDIIDLSIILRRIAEYTLNMSKGDKKALKKVKAIVGNGVFSQNMSEFINSVGTLLGLLKTKSELDVRSI